MSQLTEMLLGSFGYLLFEQRNRLESSIRGITVLLFFFFFNKGFFLKEAAPKYTVLTRHERHALPRDCPLDSHNALLSSVIIRLQKYYVLLNKENFSHSIQIQTNVPEGGF